MEQKRVLMRKHGKEEHAVLSHENDLQAAQPTATQAATKPATTGTASPGVTAAAESSAKKTESEKQAP